MDKWSVGMKKTYYAIAGAFGTLAILLLAAAVPSQTDFDGTYFQTNALPITLGGNLTNWSKLTTNAIASGGEAPVGTVVNTGASTARAVPVFSGTDGTNTVPSAVTIDASNNLLVGNGSANVPSLGWTSDADGSGAGLFRAGANVTGISANGSEVFRVGGSYLNFSSSALLEWGFDTVLLRDGVANTLAQRNGTAAQKLNVYNTWSDASNYERGVLDWITSAAVFTIGTEAAGTGTARTLRLNAASGASIQFRTGNVLRWTIDNSGNLTANTDNSWSIGGAAGNRPADVNVADDVTAGGTITGLDFVMGKTITAAGTTGDRTINTASGSVNFAAAAQTITVTCSLVDANSIIMATVATDDATAFACKAIPGTGSFILKLNAAATAETRVNFLITN